jgi:hypothetical protein
LAQEFQRKPDAAGTLDAHLPFALEKDDDVSATIVKTAAFEAAMFRPFMHSRKFAASASAASVSAGTPVCQMGTLGREKKTTDLVNNPAIQYQGDQNAIVCTRHFV